MEKWKAIPDYEGLYEASTLGRIKSLPRNGTIKTERILKPKVAWNNRLQIALNKNDKRKTFLIHRLIAKTHILNPNNKPCINHIDGNPQNNNIENLEWCTHSENDLHAYKIGLKSMKGDKHNNRKLNSIQVKEIRALSGTMFQREIAVKYGVSRTMITHILNNKNWMDI